MAQGFLSPMWMTFRQASERGAHVREGKKGSLAAYATSISRTEESEDGEDAKSEIHYMKGYTVFNVEQIEALPEHYSGKPEQPNASIERNTHAEALFAATKADVRHRGDRAFTAWTATMSRCSSLKPFAMP